MRISKDFQRSEFACKCGCGFDTVDVELIEVLQDVRDHFGEQITITSGCRCPYNNEKAGGAQKSQHLFGRAADFKVEDVAPGVVAQWLVSEYRGEVAVGLYYNRVHVDTRSAAGQFWHVQ